MNIYEYRITENLVCPNIIREKAFKPQDDAYHLQYRMNVNNILLSRYLDY